MWEMIYPQGRRIIFLKNKSDHVLPWDDMDSLSGEVAFESRPEWKGKVM